MDSITYIGNGSIIEDDLSDVIGNGNIVKANNCNITGNHNNIIGNSHSISGDYNTITGNNCKIVGERNYIEGNDCEIIGDGNNSKGSGNISYGSRNVNNILEISTREVPHPPKSQSITRSGSNAGSSMFGFRNSSFALGGWEGKVIGIQPNMIKTSMRQEKDHQNETFDVKRSSSTEHLKKTQDGGLVKL